MTTAYTSLLGLALPVTGELSGTWGSTVNTEITALLDSAVAGTTTISADADITLTTTTGAANESREAILLWTAGGTVTRNITAPAQSKAYIVINKSSSTQSIVLRGVGPTTGVTIAVNEKAVCAWNGSDFVKVASTVITNLTGAVTSVGNATLLGSFTSAQLLGALTDETGTGAAVFATLPTLVTPLLGTPTSGVMTNVTGLPLTTGVTGTLPVANGGTGVTTSTGTTNVVLSNSPTLVTPALGTPSALVGTNITGTASGLTAGNVTTNANLIGAVTSVGNTASLGSFTSAQLLTALTDETGTGAAVFATSPTLVTPILGTPTSGTLTNCTFPTLNQNTTGTAAGLSVTLAVASGGTGVTTSTGSGNNVLSTSPTLVTPILGTPTSGTLTNCTFPTLNQNTTGTAAGLSTTLAVASGGTGVTSSTGSGSVVLNTSPTLTTPTINSAQVSTISGSAPLFLCRAWVNFNGTGTIAIRGSGNVTSLTDNGTGDYTVNFTTAMSDTNYTNSGNIGSAASGGSNNRSCQFVEAGRLTGSVQVVTGVATTSGLEDQGSVYVSVFR